MYVLSQDAPDVMKNYVEILMKNFLKLINYKEDMHVRLNVGFVHKFNCYKLFLQFEKCCRSFNTLKNLNINQ